MLTSILVLTLACAADPAADRAELVKRFREEFVPVTPGEGRFPKTFSMGRTGESGPVHTVTLPHRFQIAKYEVPQNLWEAVMGSNPSRWKGPRNSVEMLSFEEAQQFCRQVTEALRTARLVEADEEVRLPTEAEWEYCARAGTSTVYSFGDSAAKLGDYAWSTENAKGNDPPVGAKLPNAWGLFDVHGYLWEWCQDAWHDDYTGAPADGSAWMQDGKSDARVVRGGSWKDTADRLTSSFRTSLPRGTRDDAVGLRCVLAKVAPR